MTLEDSTSAIQDAIVSESAKAPALDESILRRLLGAANDLLDDGSSQSAIEMTIYKSLVADTPSASLFRAGIGLAEPFARDFASRLAELIGRALRGPRDLTSPVDTHSHMCVAA